MSRPYRAELRDAAVARLREAVPAVAGRVHASRALPLLAEGAAPVRHLPCLLVYAARERKATASGGTAAPFFETTLTLAVHARVEAVTEAAAEAALDALAADVEDALLADPGFVSRFREAVSVETTIAFRAEGDRVLAEAAMAFDLTWHETFEPTPLPPLAEARIRVDAIDPADPLGAYPAAPPFPAPAAPPRARGPDGRAEAAGTLTLPQD